MRALVEFTYKPLGSEHAERWKELRLEGARDFPLGFLVTVQEVSATSLARCREILGYGSMRGVFSDDVLVGFCGYRAQRLERTRHRCEIGPFFVTRDLQGSGAATAMMNGVVEEAKTADVSQIELFVDTENPRAIAFYERHGFQRITTFKDSVRIDGQSRSDHFMTLKL